MGTSSNEHNNDLHSKLQELQNRKKEIEAKLAHKNEELYNLCVTEVHLTGILPPETPHTNNNNNARPQHIRSSVPVPVPAHVPPPTTNTPTTSSTDRRPPSHASGQSRHHTITSEHISRVYWSRVLPVAVGGAAPGAGGVSTASMGAPSTLIATSSSGSTKSLSQLSQSNPCLSSVPLLYQYAAQLKARGRQEQAAVLAAACAPRAIHARTSSIGSGSVQSIQSQKPRPSESNVPIEYPPHHHQLHYRPPPEQRVKKKEWYESNLDSPSDLCTGLDLSGSQREVSRYEPQEERPIRRTASASRPRAPPPRRSPEITRQQSPIAPMMVPLSPIRVSPGTVSAVPMRNMPMNLPSPQSQPPQPQSPLSPTVRPDVAYESPKNCTVVESGKWIPYREVTKPFEMSDFYKYSTKFRQNPNNPTLSPVADNNNFPTENNNEPPPRPPMTMTLNADPNPYLHGNSHRSHNPGVSNGRRIRR